MFDRSLRQSSAVDITELRKPVPSVLESETHQRHFLKPCLN